MGMGMFYSHMRRRKPTRKCERCGLRHTIDLQSCPHCTGLTDEQVVQLKKRFVREQIGNSRLGSKMLLAAGVLVLLVLAMAI